MENTDVKMILLGPDGIGSQSIGRVELAGIGLAEPAVAIVDENADAVRSTHPSEAPVSA